MKGDIDLSSGYGDYRSGGRFHVGLDLRTGGQIGAKVLSPVDGYVWRIRVSYSGYGKGLYLKGNDGYIYVFGHLSGYNETIQSVVTDDQFRLERYFVDLQFPSDSIPVKLGQLIAYSGETGAGGPHLHFEKRTGDNVPLNPLSHGFRLEDRTPPLFERLGIHLLDDRSLFSGGLRTMFLAVKKTSAGQYQVTQPVTLSTPFGLLADCFDLTRPDGRRQAVYRLTLTIDDSLYYESTLDSLSYDIGPIVDLIYEPTQAAEGDQRVRRAYRPVAGDWIWKAAGESYGGKGTGRCAYGFGISPVLGEHRAVIAAEDVFGNRSELVLRFNYVETGSTRAL
ncbi:MAG: M23 family metallopeptidase, partial [candidate division Zixibacteria bacterium]|nr:M23 family metallopeptidase [candidate division Zixibacteria bacterium]